MPYIKQEERKDCHEIILKAIEKFDKCITPGQLNYIITNLCSQYVNRKGENYTHYNDIIGVLECAKLEFYRRRIQVYENSKIKENGDVHEPRFSI